jgi:hypothetical protein
MAGRDEEQQAATVEQDTRRLSWRDMLGHVPAVLLVGGLLLYGFLNFCYARFYGRLGVDPNDVGLSYIGTLTRASGLVVGFLIVLGVPIMLTVLGVLLLSLWRKPPRWFESWMHPRALRLAAMSGVAAVTYLAIYSGVSWTDLAANEVRAGKAVSPPRFPTAPFRGLEVFAIRAAPTTVEPVGKPSDSPAAERLRGRRLLYLGQSGGTVVLYDAATQQAIYVPGSSVILHVVNCDAKPRSDAACQPTVGRR